MRDVSASHEDTLDTLPRMPSWVTSNPRETSENPAFLSGAALGALHHVLARAEVPQALLRERLALQAAGACVRLTGRNEGVRDLRDEVHLLRRDDVPGPAGAIYGQWRRAVARPVSQASLQRALPELTPAQIGAGLKAGRDGPVAHAARLLEAVLADSPRAETAALILADAALAQDLGWPHVVPLLAAHLTPRDLRAADDALRQACGRAVLAACLKAVPLAHNLARQAATLRAVAPKLRAKGAGRAVEMFLSRDALSPSGALCDPAEGTGLSDRAARRLCDRLVALGAVRELTGRDTFRLYGV